MSKFVFKRKRTNQEDEPATKKSCLKSLVEIFLLAWFICGEYFKIFKKVAAIHRYVFE